mmetsp:Transcript_28932/g.35790  ORF Transcript_28932/g.35790 Transcript_28932/m.35790 type:complete len:703 (-) Transcript_28932:22-2130(-)
MFVLLAMELLAVGRIVNHGFDDSEGDVAHVLHRDRLVVVFASLHRSESRRLSLALQLTLLEQLRAIHLKQVDLFPDVVNLGIDHNESFLVPALTLNVDLHEELPALLLFSEGDSVLARGVLLAAHFNRRVDVEDRLLLRILNVQKVLDRLLLVFLYIAVQQECCVIFVVINVALGASLRLLFISDQLIQVLDQVIELCDLDVVLDDIAGVEEANSFDVLLDSLIVLLLVEELVGVLLNYLTLDLAGEVRLLCDRLSLRIVRLLHQIVNLDVVLHGVEADELAVDAVALIDLGDVVDALLAWRLFNLHVQDVAVGGRVPVHGDLILEIVDGQLGHSLRTGLVRNTLRHCFHLNHVLFEEVDHLLVALELVLSHVGLMALEAMDGVLFLVLLAEAADHVHHQNAVAAVRDPAQVQLLGLEVVYLVRLHTTRDIVEEQDALLEQHIHLVVGLLATDTTGLLVNVQIGHLPIAMLDLVSDDGSLRDLLWEQVAIRRHEPVDVDLVALNIDTAVDTIARHRHLDHLILVIALVLFAKADAFGGELSFDVTVEHLLVRPVTIPSTATVQAIFRLFLVSLLGALDQRHEVPNFDEVGLLVGLVLLIEAQVFAHCEEELVARIHHFLQEARLVVDHKRLLRVVHNHILCQIQVLADWLLAHTVVLSGQEEEVVVEEDHAHDLDQAVALQTHLRAVLVPRKVLMLKQTNLL